VFLLGVPPPLAIGLLALATRERPAEPSRSSAASPSHEPSRSSAANSPHEPSRSRAPSGRYRTAPAAAPAARPRNAGGPSVLDPAGALLLAVTLGLLVHGLVEAARPGGAPTGLLAVVGAVAAGAVLARHERRAAQPLLAPEVLRSVPVVAGLAVLLAASAALFGSLFVATYFLQDVQGLDPLGCALRVLPLAVLMVLGAPLCPPLQRRFGPRRTATAGAALLTLGVLLLARLDATAGAAAVGVSAALLGAGFVTLMVTATSVVVHRAPEAHAGVAGGLQQTVMNIGPALGVATATLLLALVPDGGFVPSRGAALPALVLIAALAVPAALALPRAADRRRTRPEPPSPRAGGRECVRS
ncbi:MFS transporter, partial [Streptomyces sp. NPDC059556]|uniref:MFS transporter n=1 Tax=Streptomyces sp. NPDC059556 TaxID=3346863 RepID=UPI0036A2928D